MLVNNVKYLFLLKFHIECMNNNFSLFFSILFKKKKVRDKRDNVVYGY